MSPASYLTAPPRVAAKSLAPKPPEGPLQEPLSQPPCDPRPVLVPVWVALGLSLAVVLAALAFAVTRGLGAWRTYKQFRRRVVDGQAELLRRAAAIERRMGAANESAIPLQRAQAELQDSLATAGVLSGAVGEGRATVGRLTGLVPSK